MDPNQALKDLRDAFSDMTRMGHHLPHAALEAGEQAQEIFAALDEWLTNGGFPPEVWVH